MDENDKSHGIYLSIEIISIIQVSKTKDNDKNMETVASLFKMFWMVTWNYMSNLGNKGN